MRAHESFKFDDKNKQGRRGKFQTFPPLQTFYRVALPALVGANRYEASHNAGSQTNYETMCNLLPGARVDGSNFFSRRERHHHRTMRAGAVRMFMSYGHRHYWVRVTKSSLAERAGDRRGV